MVSLVCVHREDPKDPERVSSIVVRARGATWELHASEGVSFPKHLDTYSPLAQESILSAWWGRYRDWVQVDDEACKECGHRQPVCLLCQDPARHFLESKRVYLPLCDLCVEYVQPAFDYEVVREGELGMVACCDGCICDTWR